jgi:hypothetical protein
VLLFDIVDDEKAHEQWKDTHALPVIYNTNVFMLLAVKIYGIQPEIAVNLETKNFNDGLTSLKFVLILCYTHLCFLYDGHNTCISNTSRIFLDNFISNFSGTDTISLDKLKTIVYTSASSNKTVNITTCSGFSEEKERKECLLNHVSLLSRNNLIPYFVFMFMWNFLYQYCQQYWYIYQYCDRQVQEILFIRLLLLKQHTMYICVIILMYFYSMWVFGERTFKIPHKHKYEIRNQVISRQ